MRMRGAKADLAKAHSTGKHTGLNRRRIRMGECGWEP